MTSSRLRTKMFRAWLHEEEFKFLQEYSEKHFMTMSEMLRFWIHKAMQNEGVYKEPSKTIKPKNKGG